MWVQVGWGWGERLHQDPTALDCQLVERWRRGESESHVSVIPFSAGGTAIQPVVVLKGKRPGLLQGGGGQMATPASEIVGLTPNTTPGEMLLRSVGSDVVDGTGCGGGERWCHSHVRRVGRARGTATPTPCKALDSP